MLDFKHLAVGHYTECARNILYKAFSIYYMLKLLESASNEPG